MNNMFFFQHSEPAPASLATSEVGLLVYVASSWTLPARLVRLPRRLRNGVLQRTATRARACYPLSLCYPLNRCSVSITALLLLLLLLELLLLKLLLLLLRRDIRLLVLLVLRLLMRILRRSSYGWRAGARRVLPALLVRIYVLLMLRRRILLLLVVSLSRILRLPTTGR